MELVQPWATQRQANRAHSATGKRGRQEGPTGLNPSQMLPRLAVGLQRAGPSLPRQTQTVDAVERTA